jgi:membrane protease YdiL (CAAX protease family)
LLPVLLVAAHSLNGLIYGAPFPKTGLLSEPWWIPVLFIIFVIMQFAEELGWRGYALDRLQQRWNSLFSSILLGSIWAVWHIPMFLTIGFGQHDNHLPFGQFFLTLVFMSIFITWLQNNTKNSLAPAFIIHSCINLSGEVLPLIEKNNEFQGDYTAWILVNVLLFFAAIIVIKFWGYKSFIRSHNEKGN